MNNKNLILILLAAAGAGYFLLKRKKETESGDIIEPTASGNFELPPGTLTQGRGMVAPSAVVPFSEPVSSFIPAGSTNLKAPTSTTEMPQTPEQLKQLVDDIMAKWFRWRNLLDVPIINGTINTDYTIASGPPQVNPLYKLKTTRNSLNTPLPNIALIPNLQSWFWNNTQGVWQIMTRTA